MRVLVALFASGLVAGCATSFFSSGSLTKPSDRNGDAVGISYSLPRGFVGLRVLARRENAQILVCVRNAFAVSDPGQQYVMRFQNSPFSADEFVVKRNERLGTLREIDIKAYDQFDQFVVNLGTSAGAIKGALGARLQAAPADCDADSNGLYEIGDIVFDPVDRREYEKSMSILNTAVTTFIKEQVRDCALRDRGGLDPRTCREFRRLYSIPDEDVLVSEAGEKAKVKPIVRMRWALPTSPGNGPKPRCDEGFCYRHTLPHTVHLTVGDSSVYSYTFQLPNSSPIVALDLPRAIAVTKTTKIIFGRLGEIRRINVKKGRDDGRTGEVTDGAEAVELALLPGKVVNAYFRSLRETTQIIGGSFQEQKPGTQEEIQLINARKELVDKLIALENAQSKADEEAAETEPEFVLAASNAVPYSSLPQNPRRGAVKDQKDKDKSAEKTPPAAPPTPPGAPPGPGGALQ
jgi:hypothetical protein